ncbi:D-tyrosyl-tRNA(Tyr) deacylase [Aspergillus fumigatus]
MERCRRVGSCGSSWKGGEGCWATMRKSTRWEMMPEKAGNVNESPGARWSCQDLVKAVSLAGSKQCAGGFIEGGGGETTVIAICFTALHQRNLDQSFLLRTDDISILFFEPVYLVSVDYIFSPRILSVSSAIYPDMKAVIQRVKSASVTVDEKLVSSIGRGLLVLAGVGKEDTEKDADTLIQRVLKAKLWPAEEGGQWKRNVQDIEGEVLCVSQFTLYGQLKKGSKPDFHDAADAETARKLYEYFFRRLGEAYKPDRVKNGVFQAMMDVELKNDGPVGVDYRSEDAAVSFCSSSYLVSD